MTTHHRDLQAHAQEGPPLCQLTATRPVGVYIALKKKNKKKTTVLDESRITVGSFSVFHLTFT